MNILVADDDVASRTILTALLKKTGHEVTVVDNGMAAFEILSGEGHPDMVILDWLMPGKDGAEICRELATIRRKRPLYIIMLTIKGKKSDVIDGLDAGANDYISKPYDPGELYARINAGKRILELQQELSKRLEILEENDRRVMRLLAEKELLIREVHHRIKNGISAISAMLKVQADSSDADEVRSALREAAGRLSSVDTLYERLYQSGGFEYVHLREYLTSVVTSARCIFGDPGNVSVDFDVQDLSVAATLASNIGFVVNELVFNAYLHAFVGRDSGSIRLTASHNDNETIVVTVADDGVGMPASFDMETPTGFGLSLVRGIVSQLGGSILHERAPLNSFIITIRANDGDLPPSPLRDA